MVKLAGVVRGPLHESLSILEGAWRGEGEVFASPWGPSGKTRGSWNFRFDMAGLHLIHDYQEQREDGFAFEGHGVLAVDAIAQDYVWYWFDTLGHLPEPPARGGWTAAGLRLQKTTPRGQGLSTFEVSANKLTHGSFYQAPGAGELVPVARSVMWRVPS